MNIQEQADYIIEMLDKISEIYKCSVNLVSKHAEIAVKRASSLKKANETYKKLPS